MFVHSARHPLLQNTHVPPWDRRSDLQTVPLLRGRRTPPPSQAGPRQGSSSDMRTGEARATSQQVLPEGFGVHSLLSPTHRSSWAPHGAGPSVYVLGRGQREAGETQLTSQDREHEGQAHVWCLSHWAQQSPAATARLRWNFPEYYPGPRLWPEGWVDMKMLKTSLTRQRNDTNHSSGSNVRTGSKGPERSFLAGGPGVHPGGRQIMGRSNM